MYMLNSVGEKTPPCGTPVLNLRCEDSSFVDLQYDETSLTFTAGSVSLCCVCGHVVVFGLSVMLSWYPVWMRWLL